MLDIRMLREQTGEVKAALARAGVDPHQVDAVLAFDERRRQLIRDVEALKAVRNAGSKEVARLRDAAERDARIVEMRAIGDQIAALDRDVAVIEQHQQDALLELRNLPHPAVPDGPDETANVILVQEGEPCQMAFTPRPHWELGEALGIIDFERGVKLSGSRFYVLRGQGARLQRALIQWMLDLHGEQGYEEVYTPFVVKEQCMWGARQLPKFRDNLYRDVEDDLWLVPTAEVPVTNLHRDEIFEASELPRRYCAYTPCFRREKMSAGRDVRGIKRGHQFDKVEMYMFVRPEESEAALEQMRADAEETCRRLGIPFRVKALCTGDLGFAATRTYDLELWAPGQAEWLEVSSCSNVASFQARAANVRYRPAPGARPDHVHTLNGSGLGLPRTMIAILENYQRADGSIAIPEVLQPYMGGMTEIRAAGR
jgi:seryl-tRNA synthetase